MNYTEILDIEFDNAVLPEAVEQAMWLMKEGECCYAVCPGSRMTREYHKNRLLRNAVNSAEMILPCGSGVMLASRILGTPLAERISRVDFCSALLARMSEKGMRLFVMGSESKVVEAACDNITARYPGIKLVGSDDGYFSNDEDLTDHINEIEPDMVLIGMESPKQEKWMYRNHSSINKGLLVGIGDALSVFAGMQHRAPKRWRDSGFEWLYKLIKQPGLLPDAFKRCWVVFAALERRMTGN